MQHSFNTAIAKKYGMKAATILNNIHFWIVKNKADDKCFFEGKYWMYGSVKSFCELFDYMSEKEIFNALKKLRDENVIVAGNFNKSTYDRTNWYALTEFGESILSEGGIHSPVGENGNSRRGEPIQDITKDINTDIKKEGANAPAPAETDKPLKPKRFVPPTVEEVKAYCIERKNSIDPEAFCDYYEARGWELNKGRKMKDWRACVRTWEKKNFDSGGALSKKQKWREQKEAYIHNGQRPTEAELFPGVFTEVKHG